MTRSRSIATLLVVLPLLALLAACNDDGSPTEANKAFLRATVHQTGGSTAVVGATVTVQGKSATSNADGNLHIRDLEPGNTPAVITAAGFQTINATLTLLPGDNFRTVAMVPAP